MSIKSFGTIGMGRISNALRVVIDTNVLVSAIVFGGIPKQILLSFLMKYHRSGDADIGG